MPFRKTRGKQAADRDSKLVDEAYTEFEAPFLDSSDSSDDQGRVSAEGEAVLREPSYLVPTPLRRNLSPEEVDVVAEVLGQIGPSQSPPLGTPGLPMHVSQGNSTLIKHLNAKLGNLRSDPSDDDAGAYLDLSLTYDDAVAGVPRFMSDTSDLNSNPAGMERDYSTYPPSFSVDNVADVPQVV